MTYSAFVLSRGLNLGGQKVDGPWWIWFAGVSAMLAVVMVASVFLGRWTIGRNLAFLLMIPGAVTCLLLIWAFGLGLLFLPAGLVWVPVFVACLRMPGQERAAAVANEAASSEFSA
jgi:hypothetical protein